MTFEKLTGPIYPAYLRVGGYSITLEPELIEALKALANEPTPLFLKGLVSEVGENRYLREMIEEAIAKSEDREALADHLKSGLAAL